MSTHDPEPLERKAEKLSGFRVGIHQYRDAEFVAALAHEAALLRARAVTAETALAAAHSVIRRHRDGWSACGRADGSTAWRAESYYPPKWEPITAAEAQVIAALDVPDQPNSTEPNEAEGDR